MARIGADVEQLAALKGVFTEQSNAINTLRSTIDGRLNAVYWEGPARTRFQGEWDSSFKSALAQLQAGLEAAGTEAASVAERIRTAGS